MVTAHSVNCARSHRGVSNAKVFNIKDEEEYKKYISFTTCTLPIHKNRPETAYDENTAVRFTQGSKKGSKAE